MQENEIYTLEKFMDKNFTKPHKLKISVQDFKEVFNEVVNVLIELSNFDPEKTGFWDVLYRNMVVDVYHPLFRYVSPIKYKNLDSSFEITLPIHICLYLLDILSADKNYPTEIRITAGKLDSVIAKNRFSAKFSNSNQMIEQLEMAKPPQKEYREPQKLSDTFQKFEIGTTRHLQQYG